MLPLYSTAMPTLIMQVLAAQEVESKPAGKLGLTGL